MELETLKDKVKYLISEGELFEAINHLDLFLRKNTDLHNNYILIRGESKRAANASLIGVIDNKEKDVKLNICGQKLIQFISLLDNQHIYSFDEANKSKTEILDDLSNKEKELEFTKKQMTATFEARLNIKNEAILSLRNQFFEEKKQWANEREEILKILKRERVKSRDYRKSEVILNDKIDKLKQENERLISIIREEYSYRIDKKMYKQSGWRK